MISSCIKFFNQSRLKMIEVVADSKGNFFYENEFLDETVIKFLVDELKEEIKKLDGELRIALENKSIGQEVLSAINNKRKEKILNLVYLASNNVAHIEKLMSFIDPTYQFYNCLLALKKFECNQTNEAYELLNEYLEGGTCFPNHFLLNIVFGELLIKRCEYLRAYACLQEALRLRPDDIDVHKKLLVIHTNQNNVVGIETEQNILKILQN